MPDKGFAEAIKQYGYLGSLAASIPELMDLLKRAYGNGGDAKWDNARFSRELQDSKWWKSTQDSVKQNEILKATKPGQYRAKQDDLINKTRLIAAEMGVHLGEGGNSNLSKVVNSAMSLGWDEARLRQAIGGYWHFVQGAPATGTAGQVTQKMRALYTDQGLGFSSGHIANATKAVLTGKATMETYEAQIREAAASKYAGFADQIRAGVTVSSIAEPYRQSMAALLEMPPEKVTVSDPSIQKALVTRLPDGKPSSMPLWQFEQELRKDPRRNKTKGAVNEAYDMLRQIGTGWGFQ